MTEPTAPTYEELVQKVQDLQEALDASEDLVEATRTHAEEVQAELDRLRAADLQGQLESALAQRNTAQQQLSDAEQERVRLFTVLQDVVNGVQNWVPDLTPVPSPPPGMDPSLAATWVADQVARRREEWDRFVHRVVTQANA